MSQRSLETSRNLKKIEHDFYICVPLQFDWFFKIETERYLYQCACAAWKNARTDRRKTERNGGCKGGMGGAGEIINFIPIGFV